MAQFNSMKGFKKYPRNNICQSKKVKKKIYKCINIHKDERIRRKMDNLYFAILL